MIRRAIICAFLAAALAGLLLALPHLARFLPYRKGMLDPSGQLIIAVRNGAYYPHQYAYGLRILKSDGQHWVVELYHQPQQRILVARSLNEFAEALQSVPIGSTVYQYLYHCGEEHVVDPPLQAELERLCSKYGVALEPSEFTMCLCPD